MGTLFGFGGLAPYSQFSRAGPGLSAWWLTAAPLVTAGPQHCISCTKSVAYLPPLSVVGVPPVQETDSAWLVRSLVWLTVNVMPANSPRPWTVTAEDVTTAP